MTLDDLRVFTTVVEAGSLGAAARQLGCTQPAVSQHIRRLERRFDMPLLERSVKGITLTPAGRVFYDASSLGLGALSLAEREINRLRTGEAGRLAIATGGTTVRHFLRDAIEQFRQYHPGVTLHFEPAGSTPKCLEAVQQRRADLAFVTIHDPVPHFEQRAVLENALMLLAPSGDPLVAQPSVSPADLRSMRYISLPEFTVSNAHIRHYFAEAGVHLKPTARVDDFDTAHVFVQLGLGHAIVPAMQGHHFQQGGGVTVIPIEGLPPLQLGWATRQFRLLPPVAHDFMTIFTETAGQWEAIPGLEVLF